VDKNNILPNFIIAGVARSGTTSLYHYMKQHPQIGFPTQKEPKYFSSIYLEFPHRGIGDDTVDSIVVKDKEAYYRLFEKLDPNMVIGEASSDYLFYHQYTVDAIKKELGDIPIIFSIRNPVDRAYSAYNNLIRDGREALEFMEALKTEEERLADNWDWMWAYKQGGLYADAIEHFQKEFSKVKVVLFDDLESEADTVLRDIFEFLEVDSSVQVNSETKYSHSGQPKNKLIAMLTDRNNKIAYTLRRIIMSLIPRAFLEKIASKLLKKEDLDTKARQYLVDYFQTDIEKLETVIGRDLSDWKKA
jgi:hypothetical protein